MSYSFNQWLPIDTDALEKGYDFIYEKSKRKTWLNHLFDFIFYFLERLDLSGGSFQEIKKEVLAFDHKIKAEIIALGFSCSLNFEIIHYQFRWLLLETSMKCEREIYYTCTKSN